MTMIISGLRLFLLKPYSGQKLHLYSCARVIYFYSRQYAYSSRAIEVIVFICNAKKGKKIHSIVLDKFCIHQYFDDATAHAVSGPT